MLPKEVINLPVSNGKQTFGFTLSNVEADGPHGSFECLRQTGHRSIESLGCMQMKMHIHATEDSYENTKVKMASIEEQQKKSCTKVIKPAGAHLGRKVKVKRPGLVVSPVKYSPPTSSMMNKVAPIKPMTNISPRAPTPPSIPVPKRPEPPKPKPIPPPPPQKNPELMRQPIRDRIIHILALRPYKRPELLMKLKHEGVKEKDKNKLTAILPQISTLKGNIYYLSNYLWSEVQDNWKFCSQEEAEIIRKRKQQHLNSNNESPPSNSQSNTSPLQKRFTNESLPELPPSKKQRISHYKAEQPRPTYGNSSTESSSNSFPKKSFSPGPVPPSMPNGFGFHQEDSNSNQKSPTSDSYPNTPPPPPLKNVSNHSTSSLNQRTREDNTRNHSPGSNNSMGVPLRKPSFQKIYPMSRNQRHDVEERAPSEPHHPKSYVNSDMGRNQTLSHPQSVDSVSSSKVSPDSNTRYRVEESKTELCSKTSTNGYVNNNNSINTGNYNRNKSSYIDRSKVTSTTNGSCSNSPHSSCDSRDGMDYNHNQVPDPTAESPTVCDSPEYEREYSTIVSREQRDLYKSHFNAEYEEYLCLHKKIMLVSKKFHQLSRQINSCEEGSEELMKIKGKILKEYQNYQDDPNYVEALDKFHFLHNKLAYIKRLVTEYDNAQFARS
ncbi:hypothetical protein CDAR_495101 [Caerostris darwini]|uniref:OCEL domain-containing protein n=1 Tax=Caerostris darwini TaxID=1538125 RepID=A0AAV4N8I5_9ARAC|nr:hypothetical protein CDAR_495101 [Caerostris darwini]